MFFCITDPKLNLEALKSATLQPDTPQPKPYQVFIKPAVDTKAFSAIVEPRDQMPASVYVLAE